MKRLSIVFTCDSEPIGLYEIERRLRTAGFKRPQAGSIMDAEQSDELAEAYEQGKQAVFDAMNHFDELAIVERANPYRKDGRYPMDWRHQAACRDHDPELWFSVKPYEQAAALAICRSCPVIGECRRFADEHNRIDGYQLQGIWGGRRYGVK